jgi:hypothetical protein
MEIHMHGNRQLIKQMTMLFSLECQYRDGRWTVVPLAENPNESVSEQEMQP